MEKLKKTLWELTEKEEYRNLGRIFTGFFILFLFIYVSCLVLTSTTIPSYFLMDISGTLYQTIFWMTVLKTCFELRNYKSLIAAGVLALTYHLVCRSVGYGFLSFYAVIVIGTVGIKYCKLLKIHTAVVGLVLLTAIAAAFAGCTENLVYLYGNTLRDSFGICFPTDFASCLFYLLLLFWIAWRGLPSWVSLVLCVPFVFIARKFAISDTCVICGSLFFCVLLVFLYLEKKGRVEEILPGRAGKILDRLLIFAFPLCGVLMLILMLLYASGTGFGQWMNSFLSGRLRLAYQSFRENGIQIFGSPITQIGGGNTTFPAIGYNFVDSTYPLILIRYGWVFFLVVAFFWVRTTWLAIREKDYRLAFGMGFIAFHSLSEHHFMEINYNLLLAMPLADFTARGACIHKDRKEEDAEKKKLLKIVLALAVVALIALTEPLWMAYLRTVCSWSRMTEQADGCLLTAGVVVGAAILVAAFVYAVGEIVWSVRKKRKAPGAYGVLAAVFLCLILGAAGAKAAADRIAAEGASLLREDESAVRVILDHAKGSVCADELPVLYHQAFPEIRYPVFVGEDLSRYRNITVIVPRTREYICFLRRDFKYAPISDHSAVYTNDPGVIRGLEDAGYLLNDHYDEVRYIELPVQTSPCVDLRAGSYKIRFVLRAEIPEENEQFAKVLLSGSYGRDILVDRMLDRRDVDEDGNVVWEMRLVLPKDTQGVKFYLLPQEGASLDVKEVSYQMTRLIRKR